MLFFLFVVVLFFSIIKSQDFDFINQDKWVELSADCGNPDLNSSPININAKKTVVGNCKGQEIKWQRVQKSNIFKMLNNGKDVKWTPINKKGEAFKGIGEQLVKFANQFSSVHKEYCLDSFHIHIKSEHNITNKQFDAELHFVHFSCKYPDVGAAIEAAVSSGDKFVLGVIGVLLKAVHKPKHPYELSRVDKFLPEIEQAGMSVKVHLEIEKLLPSSLSFYSYLGGLTTPPCSPIVQWHVLKQPVEIAASSLLAYKPLLNFNNKPVIPNFRFGVTNVNPLVLCKDKSGQDSSTSGPDSIDKIKKAIRVGNTLTLVVLIVVILFGIIMLISCLKIKAKAYSYVPNRCHSKPIVCKDKQTGCLNATQARNININI